MEIPYASSSSDLDFPGSVLSAGVVARQVRATMLAQTHKRLSSGSVFSQWHNELCRMSAMETLESLLPCIRWIRNFRRREHLEMDLMAGITVGVMLVPQAMSYAKLAGLHPIYGLYSGFVPIFVYAIFGSSRQLAIGPVTLVSLLVSNELSRKVDPSQELYTELAILLALIVGVLECAMGLLRLGWLLRFISHSVISGFMTSSAIVIALSQVKYFLGYDVERSSKIIPLARSIVAGAGQFSWPPFVLGSIILAIIFLMKHLGKMKGSRFLRASGPLTAVILGTTFVKVFHPSSISVVGEIPQGFPNFRIPNEFEHVTSLLSTAVLITGVAILESVGIAKAMAAKNGYKLEPNQELLGLGLANIFGSFFSSYPATGSFSRTAVNNESGAQTGLSGIVTGLTVGCALYFMTPLFRDIPQCALAAIVVAVGISLVDIEEAVFLWHADKKDFLLWLVTCITTLLFGIEIGVLLGVVSSLAFVIYESANPYIAVLGRLPGTTLYRNIQQYPEAYICHGIAVVQIDAPLYFANVSYIKDRLRECMLYMPGTSKGDGEVEGRIFVIIEMSSVPYVDASAVLALKDLHQEYKSRDVQIVISNPNQKVLTTFSSSDLIELIGKDWYFVSVHDAVQACLKQMADLSTTSPSSGVSETVSDLGFLDSLWSKPHGNESALEEGLLFPENDV